MAEIHILPAAAACGADATRHLKALGSAHARGEDLGPRGPHIRALGRSREVGLADLHRAHDTPRTMADPDMPGMEALLASMQGLIVQLQRTMQLAREFPS